MIYFSEKDWIVIERLTNYQIVLGSAAWWLELGESHGVPVLPDSLAPVGVHYVHGQEALGGLHVPGVSLVGTVSQDLVTGETQPGAEEHLNIKISRKNIQVPVITPDSWGR